MQDLDLTKLSTGTLSEVAQEIIRRDTQQREWRKKEQPHHPIEAVVTDPPKREPRPTPAKVVTVTPTDLVYRPAHYTSGGIEAIDFIRAKLGEAGFLAYCVGNCLKYLSRAGKKRDHVQDLEKAQVYLGWAIEASLGKELTK